MTDVTQQLAKALEPFAIFGDIITSDPAMSSHSDDAPASVILFADGVRRTLTFGDLRLAKAALTAYAKDTLTAFEASRAAPADVVEAVARAIYEGGIPKGGRDYVAWEDLDSEGFYAQHDLAMKQARAALSAMPRDEAALADLALDYLHLAQPEFCSSRCPSVGREGVPMPHLPECVSMRSLLDGLPFATPGATISTGLMAKLKKLANYLTEQGEYEACDLIDTVVDRLSASPPTPARDEGLEALRELSDRATIGPWGALDARLFQIPIEPLDAATDAEPVCLADFDMDQRVNHDSEGVANADLAGRCVNYVRNKLAQEPRS